MTTVTCPRCGRTWTYAGTMTRYAKCSNCFAAVPLPREAEVPV